MFKHTTILVLLTAALLVSVYTHETADKEWKCVHDTMERHEPTRIDVEEVGFKEAREGRILTGTTYPQIRMYAYYGLLESMGTSYLNYMQNSIVPPLLSYFEAALQVKYPVSGAFKVSGSSVCGVATPSVLKTGVQADFVYFIKLEDDTSSTGDWVAMSEACSLATGSARPLVGLTTINSVYLKVQTTNILLHEKNLICTMHEMTHTLGFSSSLFPHFLGSTGETLKGQILSGSLDGAANQIINVQPLTSMLQSYFGCSTMKGAYMENSGSDATAGSHFERRQFAFETMTSGLIYEMQYSQFSLGMLESSGWYVVDYSYADAFSFNQGQGCNSVLEECTTRGFNLGDYCFESGEAGCANPGRGGGTCQSDSRSDNCMFIHPNVDNDCESTASADYTRLSNLQTFGRNTNSKCFTGTLDSGRAGSLSTFCFKQTCSGSGASTVLNIEVGTDTVQCTAAGTKTVSGYAGTITCPDPLTFCSTVGSKVCPRGCMGRGSCVNGICQCLAGFGGEDCTLTSAGQIP